MTTNGHLTGADDTELEGITTNETAVTETPLLKEPFTLNDESKTHRQSFREIM